MKKLIPQPIKDAIKVLIGKSKAIPLKKGKYHCPVCLLSEVNMNPLSLFFFNELQKNRYIHSIFAAEMINLTAYSCAECGASDRDRLYALYLDKYLAQNSQQKYNLLDIAPGKNLQRYLKKKSPINYRSGDLYMEGVDDKIDITDMNIYKENQFDIFVCSHVLEHIDDDIKAMSELYRVLKPGGIGIAMVPINLDLKEIYEDKNITTPEERWKHFGQDDHVRIYSKKGFVERLEQVGFKVNQYGQDFFGVDLFTKNAIYPTSVLYIVEK